MDKYFVLFKEWFKERENEWKTKGLIIDKATLATYAHQYYLEMSSQYGLGRISLYESNGLYWIDFEAGIMKMIKCFLELILLFWEKRV